MVDSYKDRLNKAVQDESLLKLYNLFQDMSKDKQHKQVLADEGLIEKAKNEWNRLSEVRLTDLLKKHRSAMANIKENRSDKKLTLALASCPEVGLDGAPALAMAIALVSAAGGINIAGDEHDRFHKLLMDPEVMNEVIRGWRIAWKGKLEALLSMSCPANQEDKSVRLFSIKGGPETDWERDYLQKELQEVHTFEKINVVCLENVDELIDHLHTIQLRSPLRRDGALGFFVAIFGLIFQLGFLAAWFCRYSTHVSVTLVRYSYHVVVVFPLNVLKFLGTFALAVAAIFARKKTCSLTVLFFAFVYIFSVPSDTLVF